MPEYQVFTCPNCNGQGCPTCQNTGKIKVSTEQLQQLKQMYRQSAQSILPSQFQSQPSQPDPYAALNKIRHNATLAGIATFSILSIFAGGAAASWYFLKSLKFFFASLLTLFVSLGTYLAWYNPFFQFHPPNDFLSAINNRV